VHKPVPILLAITGLLLTGCSSFQVQEYVSPETSGRVLDAATRQPIEHAVIRRGSSDNDNSSALSEKGGQQMLAQDQTRSNKDGLFRLNAQKDVLTFGGGAYGAGLTFLHSDYETLRTNFPAKLIVRLNPKGPPRLDTGDIFLQPVHK
jgi:hypothetical protein